MINVKLKMSNVLMILGMLALFSGAANAIANNFDSTGNPYDSPSGTKVIASREALYYQVNGVPQPTINYGINNLDTHEVTAEYGMSGLFPLPDVVVTPGDIAYHWYPATVEGNATTPVKFSWHYSTFEGASNWRVEVWTGATIPAFIATVEPEITLVSTFGASDNQDLNLWLRTYVPSTTVEAPSGSYITISYTIEVMATPVGKYTGGNNFTYGGVGYLNDVVNDLIVTPNITFSRTATVDAPSAYTGGAHDVVPGSIITYTLAFNNTGNGTAENIVIIGKIASNTNLAHINKTGATDNVTITAPAGVPYGTGWNAYYSSADNPNMFYGNPYGDWSLIGAVNTSADAYPAGTATYRGYTPADAQYSAKWIKFEKSSMLPVAGNRTLTWGVTVR